MLKLVVPPVAVAIAGAIVAYRFVDPAPPRHIVMATGPVDGAYHRFGIRYREILARDGIRLELRNTAGSFENLGLLEDPEGDVDVAFLLGGTGSERKVRGVRVLSSLFFEPTWIFWRGKLPETERELRGRRVAFDGPASGSGVVARRLMKENGIAPDAVVPVTLAGRAAAEALLGGEVDAACFVDPLDTPYIRELFLAPGIDVMPFARADAYVRRFRFLSRVVLPRGVVDLERDIPAADVPLIAFAAGLAAREDLHQTIVGLLLDAAAEVHGQGGLFEEPGQFPSTYHVTLPVDPRARHYLQKGPPFLRRYLPFWVAIAIDRFLIMLIPFATLLFPVVRLLPPIYRWRVRSRIYRRYRELLEIERRICDNPSVEESARCRSRLGHLAQELRRLDVPPAHADALYNLRQHTTFVQRLIDDTGGPSRTAERAPGRGE